MSDRYWVGGTGTWDASSTAHWSASSGGASGASVPTSADNAIFDASSNANAYTVTIGASVSCANLTFGNPAAGVITVAASTGSENLNIYGNFSTATGALITFTGQFIFAATATGKTITSNSVSFSNISQALFTGVGGGWTFQDANSFCGVDLSNGSLNTNGQTMTWTNSGFSSSGSATRSLTTGASAITVGSWNVQGTNFTLNATGSTITFNNSLGVSNTFISTGQARTYYDLVWTGLTSSASGITVDANTRFRNVTITHAAVTTTIVDISNNFTVTGTLSITGNSVTNRPWFRSSTHGTARTITAGAVSLSNIDISDIIGAGAATWSGTSLGNMDGNSNITFTTPVTRYWVGGTGNYSSTGEWSASSGGASGASVPLCHDDVNFNASSFSAGGQTVTFDLPRIGKNINWTGVTNTPTLAFSASIIYILGNLTYVSGMSFSSTATHKFYGQRTQTFTTNTLAITSSISVDNATGTLVIGDALTHTGNIFDIITGTLNFNDKSVTLSGVFQTVSSGTATRTINLTSSTITFIGTNGWSIVSGASTTTINPGSSTIVINNSSSSSKSFVGGGKTYNNIQWISGSTGSFSITGNNTFNELYVTGSGTGQCQITGSNTWSGFRTDTASHTFRMTAGTTQTLLNADRWIVVGTASITHTFISSSNGTAWSLFCPVGTINSDYISLRDSNATGGAYYYAGVHSTNVSGNTNWSFLSGMPPEARPSTTHTAEARPH